MKNDEQPRDEKRRAFIKKTTLAGAGVAAASMTATQVIADAGPSPDEPATQKGYQLTQHVLDYYKSASV